jgi:hypothetical protein
MVIHPSLSWPLAGALVGAYFATTFRAPPLSGPLAGGLVGFAVVAASSWAGSHSWRRLIVVTLSALAVGWLREQLRIRFGESTAVFMCGHSVREASFGRVCVWVFGFAAFVHIMRRRGPLATSLAAIAASFVGGIVGICIAQVPWR